jgi:hypothetical protein
VEGATTSCLGLQSFAQVLVKDWSLLWQGLSFTPDVLAARILHRL